MIGFTLRHFSALAVAALSACQLAPNEPKLSSASLDRHGYLAVGEPDRDGRVAVVLVPPSGQAVAGLMGTVRFDPNQRRPGIRVSRRSNWLPGQVSSFAAVLFLASLVPASMSTTLQPALSLADRF